MFPNHFFLSWPSPSASPACLTSSWPPFRSSLFPASSRPLPGLFPGPPSWIVFFGRFFCSWPSPAPSQAPSPACRASSGFFPAPSPAPSPACLAFSRPFPASFPALPRGEAGHVHYFPALFLFSRFVSLLSWPSAAPSSATSPASSPARSLVWPLQGLSLASFPCPPSWGAVAEREFLVFVPGCFLAFSELLIFFLAVTGPLPGHLPGLPGLSPASFSGLSRGEPWRQGF